MFYIDKNTELTADLIHKMISKYIINDLPKLEKWKNYYNGKHQILSKTYKDPTKPCNKIVTNFAKVITDTYGGYICGKPITYSSNDEIEDLQEVINYNDSAAEDMAFCRNALTFGVAYELQWLDAASQVRYAQVSPLNSFAVYDNSLDCELLYFIRWYKANTIDYSDTYIFEIYDKNRITKYKSFGMAGALEFIGEEPHYFKDVPVSVFILNDDNENIFNSIITLNDAYNELQSAEVDDFSAWVDAYLLLAGVDADTEDIAAMKENRVLVLPEGANATWITKNANDTQIVNMLENIKKNIYKITACPDMGDETFLAQSGTALAYKLVGFENVASGIVANFTKAIQRRIELICNILNIKASEAVWRDINITFTRNLPVNMTETIQLVNALKGTVSDKTLLAQIPFVKDVEAELEALEEQRAAQMALYSFGVENLEDDEE